MMIQEDTASVRSTLLAGIVAITLIAVIVTGMFLQQTRLVALAGLWVTHTYETTAHIGAFAGHIKDAALNQRIYLINGDAAFLDAYNAIARPQGAAQPAFAQDLDTLQNLTADNPIQQKNIAALRSETEKLVDYLDDMAALRQTNPAAANANDNALRGKEMLDHIRAGTSAMRREEERLFALRTQQNQATARSNTAFVLCAIAFFYCSMLLLSWLIYRQWQRTKAMEHMQQLRADEVVAVNAKLQAANRDLERLNAQIRETGQARLAAVVDHAIDGLITIDAKGTIETFNPACERIFGYQAQDVVGQNIRMLMPEPYHSAHDGYIQHYRDSGNAKIIGTPGREVAAKRKDGSIFPIDLAISSFFLDGEEHFSGILRDITLRKQAEAELQRYTRELEHSNQELDDFAYIASHDLKEPLRGLFNHASFLLEDYKAKLDEEGIRRLNRLSQLAQRMENLVNDLLYFSRLGRSELAIQKIDPNQIVADIVQMMESLLKERNASVTVPGFLPSMTCDGPRMTEVFRNLITNAVKYNDKPAPMIEVGFLNAANAPHGPEKNVFYVKDNGIGIEPEFHQEIFRIFKRLNKATNESGTGVGLTFVKKIIERHKGHIWLESVVGQGTSFFFNIDQEGMTNDKHSH